MLEAFALLEGLFKCFSELSGFFDVIYSNNNGIYKTTRFSIFGSFDNFLLVVGIEIDKDIFARYLKQSCIGIHVFEVKFVSGFGGFLFAYGCSGKFYTTRRRACLFNYLF